MCLPHPPSHPPPPLSTASLCSRLGSSFPSIHPLYLLLLLGHLQQDAALLGFGVWRLQSCQDGLVKHVLQSPLRKRQTDRNTHELQFHLSRYVCSLKKVYVSSSIAAADKALVSLCLCFIRQTKTISIKEVEVSSLCNRTVAVLFQTGSPAMCAFPNSSLCDYL